MKLHYLFVPVLAFALFATGCANQQAKKSPPQPQINVIELPKQTLVVQTTRDDISVGCVIFGMHTADMGSALNVEAIHVNAAHPESSTIYLKHVGKNQFELPAMRIEYSTNELGGPLYLMVKAWFNELTNQHDSDYYQNTADRYALLSYCTNEKDDPSRVNARIGANRVTSLKDFRTMLAKPMVIKLNKNPLRPDWGKYPMLNPMPPHNPLSAFQLKDVEQTVRNRGEEFIRGISVSDADHAIVTVGDGNYFRSAREYKLVREVSTWRVESIRTLKEVGW